MVSINECLLTYKDLCKFAGQRKLEFTELSMLDEVNREIRAHHRGEMTREEHRALLKRVFGRSAEMIDFVRVDQIVEVMLDVCWERIDDAHRSAGPKRTSLTSSQEKEMLARWSFPSLESRLYMEQQRLVAMETRRRFIVNSDYLMSVLNNVVVV